MNDNKSLRLIFCIVSGIIVSNPVGGFVDSILKDIIMPLIGMIFGQPDFSSIAIGATRVMKDGKEVLVGGLMIGNFLNAMFQLLISCGVIFYVVVKPVMKLTAPKSASGKSVVANKPPLPGPAI